MEPKRLSCKWHQHEHHGEDTLSTFMEDLNSFHQSIQFTAEWSSHSITFLDTHVFLTDGVLSVDLYTKPTDTHQYLSASSCHPRHCKSAIPYSQALRIRRICSSEENFVRHANELQSHLIHRGYNRSFVHQQIVRAGAICRIDALAPRSKRTKSNRVPLVTTFHPNLPNLRRITKSFFPLLHTSSRLKQAIPETPIVAYRRPKNLRDLLVSAQLKPTEFAPAHGSAACGGSRCLTCQHIQTGTTVRSSTGRIHQVRATATCKTRNVIYLIECKCCRLQYVGETKNPLHIRLNGHRNDIKHHNIEKPVAAHFCSPNHTLSDFTIMVLEQMRSQDDLLRKRRESFWIHLLGSLHPTGLNVDP